MAEMPTKADGERDRDRQRIFVGRQLRWSVQSSATEADQVLEDCERLLAFAARALEANDARRFELAEHAQRRALTNDARRLILLALLGRKTGGGGLVRRSERGEQESGERRCEFVRKAQVDRRQHL